MCTSTYTTLSEIGQYIETYSIGDIQCVFLYISQFFVMSRILLGKSLCSVFELTYFEFHFRPFILFHTRIRRMNGTGIKMNSEKLKSSLSARANAWIYIVLYLSA